MRRYLFSLTVSTLLLLAAGAARAQGRIPDAPQIADMNPPSAQRGATVEVALSGQKLAGTKELLCRYSPFPDQIPPTDRGLKAEVTAATDGQVKAKITIPADAPSGLHELRALTEQGVTNAGYFFVSQYAQVPEKEPNNSAAQATPVTLPVTVAGVINGGGDLDTYGFTAKKGQRLIFDVEGFKKYAPPLNRQNGVTYLDSFIVLRDAQGRELAYDDDASRLDAFLAYEFAADGQYFVTIRDAIYGGRGDYHYRLTIGSRPTITALFPAGGARGSRLVTTVYGYNLDQTGATKIQRAITLGSQPGVQEFRVNTSDGVSNALPVVVGNTDELAETEPNDRVQDANSLVVPAVCNGKFDSLTDVDAYRFQAQGGQRIVFSVAASRLGSPADTYITVASRSGQVIGRDDDGGGMPDARLEVEIPATDEYVVFVRNQTKTGFGPEYFYRLSVRTLQPSFSAIYRQDGVNPQGGPTQVPVDGITVQQGGNVEFELMLNRSEGQGGDVAVSLNAPPTFKGLTVEQLIKTRKPNGGPMDFNVAVEKAPKVKNGQNISIIRLTAAPDMPVGFHKGVYLRLSGMAGSQPYVLNQPLWLTVSPK